MISEQNAIWMAKRMFPGCFNEECEAFKSIRYRFKGIRAVRVLREAPPKNCSDMFRVEVEYNSVWEFFEGKWIRYRPVERPVNVTGEIIILERDDIKKGSGDILSAMKNVFCANVLILRIYTGAHRDRNEIRSNLGNSGVQVFFQDELQK